MDRFSDRVSNNFRGTDWSQEVINAAIAEAVSAFYSMPALFTKSATEIATYSKIAVTEWANQIHVTTGTNSGSTDKLMKAAGAKCVGGIYLV